MTMATTPVVVMIHGRGVKAGFDREFSTWKRALETNLGDEPAFLAAHLRLAYYSDDLYPELGLRPQAVSEREIDERLVKARVLAELMNRYHTFEAITAQT